MDESRARATALLADFCRGQGKAEDELVPLLYDRLRAVAAAILLRERRDHTLQPTALVHEVWIKLIDQECIGDVTEDGAHQHFVGLAARVMRRILVDRARRRNRSRHGGDRERVTLPVDLPVGQLDPATVLDLEAALERLAQRSDRLARLAELRIFGGLSVREAAPLLGISLSTATDDWALARAMLARSLNDAVE